MSYLRLEHIIVARGPVIDLSLENNLQGTDPWMSPIADAGNQDEFQAPAQTTS